MRVRVVCSTTLLVLLFPITLSGNTLERFKRRPSELVGGQKTEKAYLQTEAVRTYELPYMKDADMIRDHIEIMWFVRILPAKEYCLDEKMGKGYPEPELLQHALPWVDNFLDCAGVHFYRMFPGEVLKVTSLLRDEKRQRQLLRITPNAAPVDDPDERSAHMTGSVVDISTKGMSQKQIAWMRYYLVELQARGLVIALEERNASMAFHIFVHPGFPRCNGIVSY
jgi:hypothetical protein